MKFNAIVKHPGENARSVTLEGDTLAELQRCVGGLIEGVYIPDFDEQGISCYANEEGLIFGLEPNVRLAGQPIVGPIVFVGHNEEGETVSLTEAQAWAVFKLLDSSIPIVRW